MAQADEIRAEIRHAITRGKDNNIADVEIKRFEKDLEMSDAKLIHTFPFWNTGSWYRAR